MLKKFVKYNGYVRILALLIAILFVGSVVWFVAFGGSESSQVNQDDLSIDDTVPEITLVEGRADAPQTIIEYIDYKCPNCNQFHQTTGKQLRREYVGTGKVKVEYRAFPFLGPDSGRSLRGAFCAEKQGVFVGYHDVVLQYMWENYYRDGKFAAEIEDILTVELLSSLAVNAGADSALFTTCIQSKEQNSNIDRDLLEAAKDEVTGTPTFIIGGQRIVGPQPFSVFDKVLKAVSQ